MGETSTWLKNIKFKSYPQLSKDINVDVAIVGGGITGVTAAYLLSQNGKKVALIDKNRVAQAATGWTTAIITQYIDNDLQQLVEQFGKKSASLIWKSGGEAIDFIEKTIKKHKVDCEFTRVPYYVYATTKSDFENLEKEHTAAKKIEIDLQLTKQSSLSIQSSGFLTIQKQAKFHPVQYVIQLAEIAKQNGALFFEKTEVTEIKDNQLITKQGIITAKDIIVATHLPFNQPSGLKFKKVAYKTYMLEIKLPSGTLSEACYQDLRSPYHYIRVDKQRGFDRVLVGGEDHRADIKVSQEKSFKALEDYFKSILPNAKFEITNKWDGKVYETIDGLPYIGSFKENPHHYYATGFSGNGMTYGTLSAMMITDKILGKNNKYEKLYRPNRLPTASQLAAKFMDFARIFFGGVVKNSFQ